MAERVVTATGPAGGVDEPLARAFAAVRAELELSADYPQAAARAARDSAERVSLPDRDERDVPFFTIDPPGSMDLDQAMALERTASGYRVRYAIADVPAFVTPGGPVDLETWQRGQTVYMPDMRLPLHPRVLSEGAASLLPGRLRPAFVWDITLDGDGARKDAVVYRAQVRSRRRLDYEQVQGMLDDGSADEQVRLLRQIGRLRGQREIDRGGASLPIPEQEVQHGDDGAGYRLRFRPVVPAEEWNAQISLLTGMCAAAIMLDVSVGVLRTMPAPDAEALARYRRQARALGVPWAEDRPYGDFIRGLDRRDPKHLALIHEAVTLFRGAGYTPFDGTVPEHPTQAAVAAPYAHVTAPLRRLVDRFGLVICESTCRDAPVPGWVREALPRLPEVMARTDQVSGKVERQCTDAVEAAVLAGRVGERFDAVVIDQRDDAVVVQLTQVAVVTSCPGEAQLGSQVRVCLTAADVATRTVEFELA